MDVSVNKNFALYFLLKSQVAKKQVNIVDFCFLLETISRLGLQSLLVKANREQHFWIFMPSDATGEE